MQSEKRHVRRPLPVADGGAGPFQEDRVDDAGGEEKLISGFPDQRKDAHPPEESPHIVQQHETADRIEAPHDPHAARDGSRVAAQKLLVRRGHRERVEEAMSRRHVQRNERVLVRVQPPPQRQHHFPAGGDDDRAEDLPRLHPRAPREEPQKRGRGKSEGELRRRAVPVDEEQHGHEEGGGRGEGEHGGILAVAVTPSKGDREREFRSVASSAVGRRRW